MKRYVIERKTKRVFKYNENTRSYTPLCNFGAIGASVRDSANKIAQLINKNRKLIEA